MSQIGLGTWPLAGNQGLAGYGALNAEHVEATVWQAIASGLRVFDTADVYGDRFAEDLLGRVLNADGGREAITKGGFIPDRGEFDLDPSCIK